MNALELSFDKSDIDAKELFLKLLRLRWRGHNKSDKGFVEAVHMACMDFGYCEVRITLSIRKTISDYADFWIDQGYETFDEFVRKVINETNR